MAAPDPFADQLAALFATETTGEAPRRELDPYGFTVLTVCTGNICRSPLAERLLADALGRTAGELSLPDGFVSVSSSGLGALVGSGADAPVRDLARALGTNVDGHAARQFAPEHAENAHLVLTATRAQRDEVVSLAPVATGRTFSIVEFERLLAHLGMHGQLQAPERPLHRPTRFSRRLQRVISDAHAARQVAPGDERDDVEDPYRQSPEVHLRVARRINDSVQAIAGRLEAVVR